MIWAGVAALFAVAAALGLLAGRQAAELTETEAIEAVAARWSAETGGAETLCAARPGTGAVWLEVTCGPVDGRIAIFDVARTGSVIRRREEAVPSGT